MEPSNEFPEWQFSRARHLGHYARWRSELLRSSSGVFAGETRVRVT
jgi:hypothetical protein